MSMIPLEIFLKLDGIDGESSVIGHEKETIVLSYEQGIDRPAAPPMGGGFPGGMPMGGGPPMGGAPPPPPPPAP